MISSRRWAAAVACLAVATPLLAQRVAPAVIADSGGLPACVVTAASASAETPLTVDIRVPATPAASILEKLPLAQRDFSRLPVQVTLLPAPGNETGVPSQIAPVSTERGFVYPTLDGVRSTDPFVRVTYPRTALSGGLDIVGQRVATAEDGTTVTSETRCRITSEIAATWR